MRSKHVTLRLRADVIESIDVDAAVALNDVDAAEAVRLVMWDSTFHATPPAAPLLQPPSRLELLAKLSASPVSKTSSATKSGL